MFYCKFCPKQFSSYRGLNGHLRVHNEFSGRITGVKAQSVTKEILECQFCASKFESYPSHGGKYCSIKCSTDARWELKTKPKIQAGTIVNRDSLVKFLSERDGYACSECGLEEWRDQPISLDIDHIDGDPRNNLPDNLRFICPNCHRQTETWGNSKAKRIMKNGRGLSGIDIRKRVA